MPFYVHINPWIRSGPPNILHDKIRTRLTLFILLHKVSGQEKKIIQNQQAGY